MGKSLRVTGCKTVSEGQRTFSSTVVADPVEQGSNPGLIRGWTDDLWTLLSLAPWTGSLVHTKGALMTSDKLLQG